MTSDENSQSPDIRISSVGMLYMVLGADESVAGVPAGARFPCLSVEYGMAINEIPSIRLYVSLGESLSSKEGGAIIGDPERLLQSVQETSARGTTSMEQPAQSGALPELISCQVYEEASGEYGFDTDKKVFDGCIVNGGLVYKAGINSSVQVQFNCLGKAARLLTYPNSLYVEAYMSSVINKLAKNEQINELAALQSGSLYTNQKADYSAALLLSRESSDVNIVRRLALCAKIARTAYRLADVLDFDSMNDEQEDADDDVSKVFGGDVKLNLGQLNPLCGFQYNKQIYMALTAGLKEMSMFDALRQVVTSDHFALQLFPRWSCDAKDDFKIAIMPATAWAPKAEPLKLESKDIISLSMSHDVMAGLRAPDVMIANFKQSFAYSNSEADSSSSRIMGIASKDPDIEKRLQNALQTGDIAGVLSLTGLCRVRTIDVPDWLGVVIIDYDKEAPGSGIQRAWEVSNKIATALFLHYYMSDDTALLELVPGLRFGADPERFLENSIGRTVEVDLSDSHIGKYELKLRGVLRGITYSYIAGESTAVSYSCVLERVRLASVRVPESECPIYRVDSEAYSSAT